jgi:hypothetical protein
MLFCMEVPNTILILAVSYGNWQRELVIYIDSHIDCKFYICHGPWEFRLYLFMLFLSAIDQLGDPYLPSCICSNIILRFLECSFSSGMDVRKSCTDYYS